MNNEKLMSIKKHLKGVFLWIIDLCGWFVLTFAAGIYA